MTQDEFIGIAMLLGIIAIGIFGGAKNAARQPVVKNVIEQDTIVRPRILRSAQ